MVKIILGGMLSFKTAADLLRLRGPVSWFVEDLRDGTMSGSELVPVALQLAVLGFFVLIFISGLRDWRGAQQAALGRLSSEGSRPPQLKLHAVLVVGLSYVWVGALLWAILMIEGDSESYAGSRFLVATRWLMGVLFIISGTFRVNWGVMGLARRRRAALAEGIAGTAGGVAAATRLGESCTSWALSVVWLLVLLGCIVVTLRSFADASLVLRRRVKEGKADVTV